MKDVSGVINGLTKEEINSLEKNGQFAKGGFDLVVEDVIISSEDIPGWAVATEGTLTVALDITITEALKKEGIARDFVNRIQNLRKEMGMEVLDKIQIEVAEDSATVNAALREFSDYIQTETQALGLSVKPSVQEGVLIDMDEYSLRVKINTTTHAN
jgi:isoleucyl-tRNA synthetase